ncbi:MAG: TIGR02300 family protein [Alphaproteobacteria bacterium]
MANGRTLAQGTAGGDQVAKPEWGLKRTCHGCGARFYDLRRSPAHCPKCDAEFEPDVPVRTHRASTAAATKKSKVPVVVIEAREDLGVGPVDLDEDVILGDVDDETELLVDADADDAELEEVEAEDDDDTLMEDASDLGGDDDDMAEVMEHLETDARDT